MRVGRCRTPWRRLCSSKNTPVEYADKPSGVESSSTKSLVDSGKPMGSVSWARREGSRSSSSLMQRTQAFIVGAGISLGVAHFLLNEVRCLGLRLGLGELRHSLLGLGSV